MGSPDRQTGQHQINFRLSADLYNRLALWAEDERRSVSGLVKHVLLTALLKEGR